jgi:ABC-type multidrug transport system fused ATPase/permease subunit
VFEARACGRPCWTAHAATCDRDLKPSLLRMRFTWTSAVPSAMTRALPIDSARGGCRLERRESSITVHSRLLGHAFIEVLGLGYTLPGKQLLFGDVEFKVASGQRVALIGGNGAAARGLPSAQSYVRP